jgi:pyrroloquinoline quinone biosynthesis protein B
VPVHAATGLSIAIAVRDLRTGQRLFCAPGAQSLGESQLDWLRSADCVLLDDHTTWPEPDLAATASWRAHRRVRLGDQGAVPPGTDQHGFEPAYDGMVIEL